MNLFQTLSKYSYREEENYLTESFVLILKMLCARVPSEGLPLLENLLGVAFLDKLDGPSSPEFITQEKVGDGYPDITVKFVPDVHAYIEVKHNASLHIGQLEYYKNMLNQSEATIKPLVLLTRSKQNSMETDLPESEYHHVCWYEIHDWLRRCLGKDDVTDHFIKDFLAFLEEKYMSLQKVSWEYEKGVTALIDLCTMMEASISEVYKDTKFSRTAGWSWKGFYIEGCFYGIRYGTQTVVTFENENGNNPSFKRELSLQKSHFFAFEAGEQFECLVNFLRECKNEISVAESLKHQ